MTQTIYIVYGFEEYDNSHWNKFVTDSPSEAIDYFKSKYPKDVSGIWQACGEDITEFECDEIKNFIRVESFKEKIKELETQISFYQNQSDKLISELGRNTEINRLKAQKKVFEDEFQKLIAV